MSLLPVRKDLLAGRYRILSPLGAGGMGEVFLAEDTRLERRVAVKLLPPSVAERLADPVVRGSVLAGRTLGQRACCELEAAAATAEEGLHLVGVRSVWDRADLLGSLNMSAYYLGHFATCDERLPDAAHSSLPSQGLT